jgi:hypothetical protein
MSETAALSQTATATIGRDGELTGRHGRAVRLVRAARQRGPVGPQLTGEALRRDRPVRG